MKAFFAIGDFFKSSTFIKISAFLFISLAFFYLGKHWSDGYQQLIFFNSRQNPLSSSQTPPSISLSPNHNKSFDISSIINDTSTQSKTIASIPPPSDPQPPPPPPPPPELQRFGIVDEKGTMTDNFEVGDLDPGIEENWGSENNTEVVEERAVVKKFGRCEESMREYIPCLDNVEAIRRLNSTDKGERFERHCPEKGKGLNCLVPAPKGYRKPIPWPRSRDEVLVN